MSTVYIIAAITRVLKDLIQNELEEQEFKTRVHPNIEISSISPHIISSSYSDDADRLNIFMYMSGYNQSWKNSVHPSMEGKKGYKDLLGIDLHYVLTAYSKSELHTEILLGIGMKALNKNPVITGEKMLQVTEKNFLKNTFSGNESQMITISLLPLNISEISQIWTAFSAPYHPSVYYKITGIEM